jgi:6-phosphofructokinase 1
MRKVDQFVIYQSIGRDAGWLSAAAALAKRDQADPPHIICVPERVFDRDRFLSEVEKIHGSFGFVSIVCGEGIRDADNMPVSASQARDKFANVEYGAMGGSSVAFQLHRMISDAFGWRGEFQITESLPMCAIDRAVKLDLDEAYQCGQAAVKLACQGDSGLMVTLVRDSNDPYVCRTGTAKLSDVAVRAKPMPDEFIDETGYLPSKAFMDYLRPLVGELPKYAKLKYKPAAGKRL